MDSTSIPLNDLSYSIGSVITDIDNDGDLDIAVANYKFGRNQIYENRQNTKNYIKISLQCSKSNINGLGSKVYLYDSGFACNAAHLVGYREVTTNTGYASSKLPIVHFGYKNGKRFDVLIKFPSGITKKWIGLEGGRSYILYENNESYFSAAALQHTIAGFIINPKKRKLFLKILYFGILLMAFNLLIYKNTFWNHSNYFFFNLLMLFSVSYLFFILERSAQIYLDILAYAAPLLVGTTLYMLLNKSQKLRFSAQDHWKLFDLLRQLNHAHSGIKQINHLIFFINNVHKNGELKDDLIKEFKYFKTNSLTFIESIHNLTSQWNFKLAKESKISRLKKYFLKLRLKTKSLRNTRQLEDIRNHLIQLKQGFELIKQAVYDHYSCDLYKVVTEVLSEFRAFSGYAVVKPNNIVSVQVLISRQTLVQILENLFQNALDAMRQSVEKKLSIEIQTSNAKHIRLLITNKGEIIAPENHLKIFNEYFSTKQSSGLGLFHVKNLLEKYDGRIALLNSNRKEGTTFEIKLREYPYDKI